MFTAGTLPIQHRHVLRDAFEVPADALAQHIQRHAFDLGEIAHDEFAVRRPARRDREAAVADDGGGHAQRRGRAQGAVPGDLRVVVGVVVDDAGHQRQAVRIDVLARFAGNMRPMATIAPSLTARSPVTAGRPLPS
jgi:hypothetical protein